jgi:acetyl esterase/lipase
VDPDHRDDKWNHVPRPPYHPAIAAYFKQPPLGPRLEESNLELYRAVTCSTAEQAIGTLPIAHKDFDVQPHFQCAKLRFSAFARLSSPSPHALRPCILYIQPAGPIAGNRFWGIEEILEWVVDLNLICVSVEYRLAPEHRYPAGVNDCLGILQYLEEHRYPFDDPKLIGVDTASICLVSGMGGAVIAGTLARRILDRPWGFWRNLKGMLLYSPMLRCKMVGVSAAQFKRGTLWDTEQAERTWELYGSDDIRYLYTGYGNKQKDLPPTYIEVGACETHRSEATQFAEQIWQYGGDCELHVWAGASSNFPYWFPGLAVSKSAIKARRDWLKRMLCGLEEDTAGLSTWIESETETEKLLVKSEGDAATTQESSTVSEGDEGVHPHWPSLEETNYYEQLYGGSKTPRMP